LYLLLRSLTKAAFDCRLAHPKISAWRPMWHRATVSADSFQQHNTT